MSRIIRLVAVDWGLYGDQVKAKTDFDIVRCEVVGFLITEDDEKIVLTPQWFDDETTRCTLVIPKVCILKRQEFGASDILAGN